MCSTTEQVTIAASNPSTFALFFLALAGKLMAKIQKQKCYVNLMPFGFSPCFSSSAYVFISAICADTVFISAVVVMIMC